MAFDTYVVNDNDAYFFSYIHVFSAERAKLKSGKETYNKRSLRPQLNIAFRLLESWKFSKSMKGWRISKHARKKLMNALRDEMTYYKEIVVPRK